MPLIPAFVCVLFYLLVTHLSIYEALTDFATGANSLLVFHQTTSADLSMRFKKCIELV